MAPLVSYAQNGEDVYLARLFAHRDGFYVDLGACDPVVSSVTKHFYDLGWAGVNVEPQADEFEQLAYDRPRDVNLNVVVAEKSGSLTLYESKSERGLTTVDPAVAATMTARGIAVVPRTVPALSLAELCDRHVGTRTIDFLKVDVEGAERAVFAGADFGRYRPRAIVVESIDHLRADSSGAWRQLLERAGYLDATFDGINRYFVAREEPALAERLRLPLNCLDDHFIPWEYEQQLRQFSSEANRYRVKVADLEARLVRANRLLAAARAPHQPMRTRVKVLLGRAAA